MLVLRQAGPDQLTQHVTQAPATVLQLAVPPDTEHSVADICQARLFWGMFWPIWTASPSASPGSLYYLNTH